MISKTENILLVIKIKINKSDFLKINFSDTLNDTNVSQLQNVNDETENTCKTDE